MRSPDVLNVFTVVLYVQSLSPKQQRDSSSCCFPTSSMCSAAPWCPGGEMQIQKHINSSKSE